MAGTQSNSIARVYDSLSGRNRIINGNIAVAQRGTSFTAISSASYGGPDRFVCQNSGNAGTTGGVLVQSQGSITFNGTSRPALVQTATTGFAAFPTNGFWRGIQQAIEGINAYDLINQPITISFIFNTNQTGTYSVALSDSGSNTYVTTFTATANTPAYYSFTLPASSALVVPQTTGVGMILTIGQIGGTGIQTSVLNTWQSGTLNSYSGSTIWSATTNNFIAVAELQLEHGNIATPFEREAYGLSLLKCQRYYFTNRVYISSTISFVGLPVQMRATMASAAVGGTGSGFTFDDPNSSSGLICHQTSGSGQTITISTEL